MIRPNRDPREPTSLVWPAWGPALALALFIVAMGGVTTWFALRFDALRPRVGDMIVFLPAQSDAETWQLQVTATPVSGRDQPAAPCVLDPNEMATAGGSLVVEAREDGAPPQFQLHWAGLHTAKGGGDCGASADFTLDRFDLQRLANAAGGFGVKPRAFE
jgi:hypothetical protein